MPVQDAFELLDYWALYPPEHELFCVLTRAYTSWEPPAITNMSEQEHQIAHRKSLERRWAAGALNAKQLWEMGGKWLAGQDPNQQTPALTVPH